ncbi:WXG100 family type VII secretion target [Streptomyces sp. NPDC101733]|uniref:WXG100 family type VII secretion target n=1 Tax=unclassified Streptomyces TaxID=2593676 RepID=UPI0037F2C694
MATNFEGYTHEQLLAMIASLDADTVKARAAQLTDAAKVIAEIGNSLKKHQVKGWEGEAARSFQEWVGNAGSATLRLGDYSAKGAEWMTHAAQTMIEVKANTPKYDTAAADNLAAAHEFHNDPDAQKIGQTAHSKLSGDHQLAVQQLTKLAQSYEASSTQLGKAEAPTFPPPPAAFEPSKYGGQQDRSRSGGGSADESGSGRNAAGSAYASSGGPGDHSGESTSVLQPQAGATLQPPTGPASVSGIAPGRDLHVDLDHVATLPGQTALPATTGPGAGVPVAPGSGGAGTPGGFVPPVTFPLVGGGPSSGLIGAPATRPPGGSGVGKIGGVAGLPPRDSGIVGGRPISSGGPGAGIPRGTVIGAEGAQSPLGRGMGGGMMGGGGVGGPHGPSGGSVAGRRLAVEPGGVVGGRQAAPGGRPVSGGQAFTQGGSGLVRGGSAGMAGGAMGHGGPGTRAPGNRRGNQGGERPDYLAEDEETWQGDRRVVPPVVD